MISLYNSGLQTWGLIFRAELSVMLYPGHNSYFDKNGKIRDKAFFGIKKKS